MGLIREVYDAVKNVGTTKIDEDAQIDILEELLKPNSISSQAKKSFFVYPVLFSDGLTDFQTYYSISKFLENQYAAFTIIASDLHQIMDKKSVQDHIATVSTESLGDWVSAMSENMSNYHETAISMEAPVLSGDDETEDPLGDYWVDDENKPGKMIMKAEKLRGVSSIGSQIQRKMGQSAPTIIELRFRNPKVAGELKISIAIKTNAEILSQSEMGGIFDYVMDVASPKFRLYQVKSGEKKFWKDFILQMDRAERDKELYARLGKHPWFRTLQTKNMKRYGSLLLKLFNQKAAPVPPTTSIICTKNELVSGIRTQYSNILRKPEFIQKILNKMLLLCLGVYDTDLERVDFFFHGFNRPISYDIQELHMTDRDSQRLLIETLNATIRKMR